MDGARFDDLARALLAGGSPRRLLLRLSALALGGGLAAFLLDDDESEAGQHKNKKKRKRKKRKRKERKRKKKSKCNGDIVSVQAAIDAASADDTIILCAGTFTGNLTINKDLTLVGAGEDATTLQGDGNGTVVTVTAGPVRIENLRITGGMTEDLGFGGGIFNQADATLTLERVTVTGNNTNNGYGNGIYNAEHATLTVEDCTISENGLDAPGDPWGGGIYNEGVLTVTNSALTGNRANAGAGLYDYTDTGAILTGCDISDNVAFNHPEFGSDGAGIYSEATFPNRLTATGCTIRNNSGPLRGGGVSLHSGAIFIDCEISGNSASEGGGIFDAGSLDLDNTAVTGNSADTGGGIYTFGQAGCTNGSTVSGNTPDQCFAVNPGGCDLCPA